MHRSCHDVTKTVPVDDNNLKISSGTLSSGRFVTVENAQKLWEGELKGGKEKWPARRDALLVTARSEIEGICGEWFVAMKAPIYNMLDSDETLGGAAPALGVAVSMAAYIAAEANTQVTNIPSSVYIEFSCQDDKK